MTPMANYLAKLAEGIRSIASPAAATKRGGLWPSDLRWIPTSPDHFINAENRLLSLVKTPFTVEQVNIGSGPPESKVKWNRSASNEPRLINTVSFDSKEGAPTLVIHGFTTTQGYFFRNFDALAKHFKVIAMDQLGWGGSSRPNFTCKDGEESEAWCIDSFEEWRKAKNLSNFTLLGHSFGGYVAAKYALKYPEHVQHLILVGPAGFAPESKRLREFKATQEEGAFHVWERNFNDPKIIRLLGPWGPHIVNWHISDEVRPGDALTEEESRLLADYVYHSWAAKASGELCLKYLFAFHNFEIPHSLLVHSASEWKVPTTFIYGVDDWRNYRDAKKTRKNMKVPCEIVRVPQARSNVFLENASGFHSAVMYGCRKVLYPDICNLPEGLTSV